MLNYLKSTIMKRPLRILKGEWRNFFVQKLMYYGGAIPLTCTRLTGQFNLMGCFEIDFHYSC